jgi:hypothetical protein
MAYIHPMDLRSSLFFGFSSAAAMISRATGESMGRVAMRTRSDNSFVLRLNNCAALTPTAILRKPPSPCSAPDSYSSVFSNLPGGNSATRKGGSVNLWTGALLLIVGIMSGCASVKYGSVDYAPVPSSGTKHESDNSDAVEAKKKNAEADDRAAGIRYYETSPYLLVFSDGKGAIKWKIYYLPDQTLKRTIEASAFLASVNTAHTFSNGTLVSGKGTADSTAIPKAIITALQGILSSGIGILKEQVHEDGNVIPAPQLFKIVLKDGMIELQGGPGDVPVRVSIK